MKLSIASSVFTCCFKGHSSRSVYESAGDDDSASWASMKEYHWTPKARAILLGPEGTVYHHRIAVAITPAPSPSSSSHRRRHHASSIFISISISISISICRFEDPYSLDISLMIPRAPSPSMSSRTSVSIDAEDFCPPPCPVAAPPLEPPTCLVVAPPVPVLSTSISNKCDKDLPSLQELIVAKMIQMRLRALIIVQQETEKRRWKKAIVACYHNAKNAFKNKWSRCKARLTKSIPFVEGMVYSIEGY